MGFQPFYEGVLGFAPNMIEGIIDFQPSIPLNLRRVEAPCLALGSNCLALSYECTTLISDWIEVTQHFRIHMEKEIPVRFTPWIPKQSSDVGISVNNEPLHVRTLDGITSKRVELDTSISGKKLDISITYTAPFLVLPIEPQLAKGKKSSQPRIIAIRRISESDYWQLIVRSPGKITSIPIMASRKIEAENADIVGNELIVKGNKSNSYKTVTVLLKGSFTKCLDSIAKGDNCRFTLLRKRSLIVCSCGVDENRLFVEVLQYFHFIEFPTRFSFGA
jgi:hypothetical protein